jgi:hypothetical protein
MFVKEKWEHQENMEETPYSKRWAVEKIRDNKMEYKEIKEN